MNVDWEIYRDCLGKPEDEDGTTHTCAVVVFENEDGRCRHFACEGPHLDCGRIVEVIPLENVSEWERRVRAYEEQGCTRSDAQSVVDVEFQKEGRPRV